MHKARPDWIAAQLSGGAWRVWAMQQRRVLEEARGDLGAGDPQAVLADLVGGWLSETPLPVIACGLPDAPRVAVPAKPAERAPVLLAEGGGFQLFALPALIQTQPADLMPAEAAQIAGFLSLNRNWDGVICLPGAETRWAHVSADEIVSFQTCLTGTLCDLVARHSVLRPSIGTGWDADAFADALAETLSRPERLASGLYAVHARSVLQGDSRDTARARLFGLMLGAELAAARPYWLGQNVAVIGEADMAEPYVSALALQGVPATQAVGREMVLAGLGAARAQIGHAA
jgi:2-dehydro-3-deoxygalactonokinase